MKALFQVINDKRDLEMGGHMLGRRDGWEKAKKESS